MYVQLRRVDLSTRQMRTLQDFQPNVGWWNLLPLVTSSLFPICIIWCQWQESHLTHRVRHSHDRPYIGLARLLLFAIGWSVLLLVGQTCAMCSKILNKIKRHYRMNVLASSKGRKSHSETRQLVRRGLFWAQGDGKGPFRDRARQTMSWNKIVKTIGTSAHLTHYKYPSTSPKCSSLIAPSFNIWLQLCRQS